MGGHAGQLLEGALGLDTDGLAGELGDKFFGGDGLGAGEQGSGEREQVVGGVEAVVGRAVDAGEDGGNVGGAEELLPNVADIVGVGGDRAFAERVNLGGGAVESGVLSKKGLIAGGTVWKVGDGNAGAGLGEVFGGEEVAVVLEGGVDLLKYELAEGLLKGGVGRWRGGKTRGGREKGKLFGWEREEAVHLRDDAANDGLRGGVAKLLATAEVGNVLIEVAGERGPAGEGLGALVGSGDGLVLGDVREGRLPAAEVVDVPKLGTADAHLKIGAELLFEAGVGGARGLREGVGSDSVKGAEVGGFGVGERLDCGGGEIDEATVDGRGETGELAGRGVVVEGLRDEAIGEFGDLLGCQGSDGRLRGG